MPNTTGGYGAGEGGFLVRSITSQEARISSDCYVETVRGSKGVAKEFGAGEGWFLVRSVTRHKAQEAMLLSDCYVETVRGPILGVAKDFGAGEGASGEERHKRLKLEL
jgi:cytochrome b involved in lipid metabolism